MTAVISGNFFLCKATVGILKQLYRTISVPFIESVVEAILSLYRSLARLPKRQKLFERDVGASLVFLATGEDLNMEDLLRQTVILPIPGLLGQAV
jgi:hypothetical protein